MRGKLRKLITMVAIASLILLASNVYADEEHPEPRVTVNSTDINNVTYSMID